MLKRHFPCRVRFPSSDQDLCESKVGTGLLFNVVVLGKKLEFHIIFKDPLSIDDQNNVSICPINLRQWKVFNGNTFMTTCYWNVSKKVSRDTPLKRSFNDNAEVEISPNTNEWVRFGEMYTKNIRKCEANIDHWSLDTRFPQPHTDTRTTSFVDKYRHHEPVKPRTLFGSGDHKPQCRRQSSSASSKKSDVTMLPNKQISTTQGHEDDDDHTDIDEPEKTQVPPKQPSVCASQATQQHACSSSDDLLAEESTAACSSAARPTFFCSSVVPPLPIKKTTPVVTSILQTQYTPLGVWVTRSVDNVIEDTVISLDTFPLTITSTTVTIGNGIQPVWNKRKSYKSLTHENAAYAETEETHEAHEAQETVESQAKRHKSVSFTEPSADDQSTFTHQHQPCKIAQPITPSIFIRNQSNIQMDKSTLLKQVDRSSPAAAASSPAAAQPPRATLPSTAPSMITTQPLQAPPPTETAPSMTAASPPTAAQPPRATPPSTAPSMITTQPPQASAPVMMATARPPQASALPVMTATARPPQASAPPMMTATTQPP